MVSNSAARTNVPPSTHRSPALERAAAPAPAPAQAAAPAPAAGLDSTEALVLRYRARGARSLLARVVERHRPVVEAIAASFASRLPPTVDVRDLVHAGLWGLMQSVETWQPERCDQFQAFMRIRVRGAMLDELRHMDFLPRLFRRRLRERDAVRARLRMDLEREPTGTELASALGISEAALLRRCEPVVMRVVRSGDDGEDRCEHLADRLADDALESPLETINRQELIELIRQSLEPIEWRVLQLHYLEGLNGKQVAKKLRLSASRICQIHGRVLDRLKARLSTSTCE